MSVGKETTVAKSAELLIAVYPNHEQAALILDTLKQMHQGGTITLIDSALVTKDPDGKVKIEETEELTARKGARRGAIAAGIFGIIYPPSLIISIAAGSAVGAMSGILRDTGVKKQRLDQVGKELEPGKSAVVALAEGDWVMRIQSTLQGYDGELVTHVIDEDTVKKLYEQAELERQPADQQA
jgi:uncharacterized membrane protein